MRKVISLSINNEMVDQLNKAALKTHSNRSEIIKKALQQYFYLQKMKNLRKNLRPYAESQGYFTDEDVFKDIS